MADQALPAVADSTVRDEPRRGTRVAFRAKFREATSHFGRREQWVAALMVAVATWTTLVNLRGDYTVHFIDNSWPLNAGATLRSLLFAWDPQQLGYLNLLGTLELPLATWTAFLQALGLPPGIQEILTLILLQAIAGFFLFLTFHRFILSRAATELRTPLAVFAALGCVTSFGVQTVYWWDFIPYGFELLAFGSIFLFLATWQMEDSLHHRPARPWRVVPLAASGAIAFSVNIPFNLSLLALAFFLPPLALAAKGIELRPWQRVLRFEVVLTGLIALVCLWWLIPAIELVQLQPAYAVQQSASINSLAVFINGTARISLLSVFQGTVGYPIYATGHYATTFWLATNVAPGLAILPVLVLFGALLCQRAVLHRPLLLAMSEILALSLFVTGVNSPLYPTVFNALFRSPILLTALRTPFVAFGEALEIVWVAAISLALATIYEEVRSQVRQHPTSLEATQRRRLHFPSGERGWRVVAVAAAALIVLSPIVAAAPGAYAGDAVPLAPYQSRMAVAPYEVAVADYLRAHLQGEFALLYPGGFLEQNWSHGYDAYDVLPSLLPGQFLIDNYREGFVVGNNTLLTDAYTTLQSGSPDTANYSLLLNRLGVRELVVEGDVGGAYPFGQSTAPDYPVLLRSLNHTANLTLAATIGPDYIYSIDNPRPLFSLANRSVPESSLLDGAVAPEVNLTRAFFNASQVTTPFVPYQWLFPTWNGGIAYDATPEMKQNVTTAEQSSLALLPSDITVFNGASLDLSVASGDYLILNFTTNAATAISVTLVTTPYLANASRATLQANSFSVGGAAENLGDGATSLIPTYGSNHFESSGSGTLLIDDMTATIGESANRTIYYILISLWPVLPNGSGIRGLPLGQWPGNQEVTISQLELGRDVYLFPRSLPLDLFRGPTGPGLSPVNMTSAWSAGIGPATPYCPADPLPAQSTPGGELLTLNASLRSLWQAASGTAAAQAFGEPTWYNSNLLALSAVTDPFLALNITSTNGTAFTAAIVPEANLTGIGGAGLANVTTYLGGAASPLGEGDPLLIPTYGAMHFVTNDSSLLLVDNLLQSLSGGATTPQVNHLFLTMFFVLPNGSGERGLPVSNWTGVQTLVVHSLFATPYLWRGNLPPLVPLNLSGEPASNLYSGPALSPNTVVLDGPGRSYATSISIRYGETDPTDYQLTVVNTSSSAIVGDVLVTFEQTFHQSWVIIGSTGIADWRHVTVDTSLNGFMITPKAGANRLTFSVEFSGQQTYASALALGLVVPPAIGLIAWTTPRWRVRFRALARVRA